MLCHSLNPISQRYGILPKPDIYMNIPSIGFCYRRFRAGLLLFVMNLGATFGTHFLSDSRTNSKTVDRFRQTSRWLLMSSSKRDAPQMGQGHRVLTSANGTSVSSCSSSTSSLFLFCGDSWSRESPSDGCKVEKNYISLISDERTLSRSPWGLSRGHKWVILL
jgi:hypothetical protein